MQPILTLGWFLVIITAVVSQLQKVHVPPGARVELDIEFVNPNSGRLQGQAGQMGGGMAGAQGQAGSMGTSMGGAQSQAGAMRSGMGGAQGQEGSMGGSMGGAMGQAGPMTSVMGGAQGQAGSSGMTGAQGQTILIGSGMAGQGMMPMTIGGGMGLSHGMMPAAMVGGMSSVQGPAGSIMSGLGGAQGPAGPTGGGMSTPQGQAGQMGGAGNVMAGEEGIMPATMGVGMGVSQGMMPMAMGGGMSGMQGMMSPVQQMIMRTMAPGRMMPHMTPQPNMQSRMTPQPQMPPHMTSQMPQQQAGSQAHTQMTQGLTSPMQTPGSAIQRLLTNMLNMALSLRRMYGMTIPTPIMEEPCPCGADCCSRPTEPRRVLPVFEIPMTSHRGCCGCVDCPISLSHLVTSMVRSAQSARGTSPPAEARK